MSKAGQNTFTGISLQADISLLYLLTNYEDRNFQKIQLEGTGWEDFTLFFSDRIESHEVKWIKTLTYNDALKIIKKEVKKRHSKDIKFKIICKTVGLPFKKDYEYLRKNLPIWHMYYKSKPISENPVVKKLLKKKWTEADILFLMETEIVDLHDEISVQNKLFEHFSMKEHLFLDPSDIDSVVSTTFRKIMEASRRGKAITKTDFEKTYADFSKALADKSESFTPNLVMGTKTTNLEDFLTSASDFSKLNHSRYLTPLSFNRRLVFHITEKIAENNFSLKEVAFFLEKVLVKQAYQFSCLKIIEAKFKTNLLDHEYFVHFVSKYYDQFNNDFASHDIFKILLEICKVNKDVKLNSSILDFIKEKVLEPMKVEKGSQKFDRDFGYKYESLPKLIEEIGAVVGSEDAYLDLLFQFFDFTGDNYRLLTKTPPSFYHWVKRYLKTETSKRFERVLSKIATQYKIAYGRAYTGYEYVGSGVENHGGVYSITDIGIVRWIFEPLFLELYKESPDLLWAFLRKNVFIWPKTGASSKYPVFLKRASVSLLIDILSDPKESQAKRVEAFSFLRKILEQKNGLPRSSEIIFNRIRRVDFSKFDAELILELVKIDGHKYGQKNLPTNIFVVETLIRMAKAGSSAAKALLLEYAANPDLKKADIFREMLNMIGHLKLDEDDLNFLVSLMQSLNFPEYLQKFGKDRWLKSDLVSNITQSLIESDLSKSNEFAYSFLVGDQANLESREFFGGVISKLAEKNPIEMFNLLKPIITAKNFKDLFSEAENFRSNLVQLGESLVAKKEFESAKLISELLFDDPDPVTSAQEDKFNYHLKVKKGESSLIIATVRGRVCWLLQKFAVSNEPKWMEYALNRTKDLLDLDGSMARSLGYAETDYYVLLQALVPLVELAHPARRKAMNAYKAGLGDSVKALAIETLKWLDAIPKAEGNPSEIAERLSQIFSYIRDLNTDEATLLLNLLERMEADDSAGLFLYFGLFREHRHKEIPFKADIFRNRLMSLCRTNGPLKRSIAWQFWNIISKSDFAGGVTDASIRPFWTALSETYHEGAYAMLAMILDDRLAAMTSYEADMELFLQCMKIEMEAIRSGVASYPQFTIRKTLPVLIEHSVSDFLTLAKVILAESDFAAGTNPYGMNLPELSRAFKSLQVSSLTATQKAIYDEIAALFQQLAVEI